MSRRAAFSAATSQDRFLPMLVFRLLFQSATEWSSGQVDGGARLLGFISPGGQLVFRRNSTL